MAETLKGKFKPSIAAEREFYKQLRKVAQYSGHIIEQHAYGARLRLEQQMMEELRKYSEKLGPWASSVSAHLLQQVQRSNKRAYQNKSKTIGIALEFGAGERDVLATAASLLFEQVDLIKSIPLEAGLRAQHIALEAALHGSRVQPNDETVRELQEQMGMSTEVATNRALLIARTETARANAAINQSRAQAVGSNQYRWHNSGDAAVRDSHKVWKGKRLQGMIFSWDAPPTLDDGMTGHPGSFPNCFPGSVQLNGFPFIQKFYRHRYAGELTEIILDDGTILSATPNHPILTMDGGRSIEALDIGEYVICEKHKALDTVEMNVKRLDFSFEKFFDTICTLPIFVKSIVIGGQFHGDVTNQEVDIVSPDCGLVLEINSSVEEKFLKLGFSKPDMLLVKRIFQGKSGFYSDFSLFSANCGMSSADLFLSLLKRHFTPLELFCFILSSNVKARENEMSPNDISTDSKVFGDLIFAYAILIHGFDALRIQLDNIPSSGFSASNGSVYPGNSKFLSNQARIHFEKFGNLNKCFSGSYELRRVIKKNRIPFASHVYNLQTVTGYYSVEGVCQMNCRCMSEPIFPDE